MKFRWRAIAKAIHIEALTMVDMTKGHIIPACISYQNELTRLLYQKKACGNYDASLEEHLLGGIAKLSSCLLKKLTALEEALLKSKEEEEILAQASFYRDKIFSVMAELRLTVDELETLVARKHWHIIPACISYQNELTRLLYQKKACGNYDASLEEYLLDGIAKLSSCLLKKLTALEEALLKSKEEEEILDQASFYRDKIFSVMAELRLTVDELETLVARKHWPFPTYAELLYSVV